MARCSTSGRWGRSVVLRDGECVTHRQRYVVPAKAGTHNHRTALLRDAEAAAFSNNTTLW
ncbi:hypothetical protein ACVIYL_005908 [Bradyrhizobium sp. USDA 3315]